jgi:hypothetical protein
VHSPVLEVRNRCGSLFGVQRSYGTALLLFVQPAMVACSNTPIDAILALDAAAEGGAGGSGDTGGGGGAGNTGGTGALGGSGATGGVPVADCTEPVSAVVAGSYRLVLDETGQCLASGDETLIAGTLATGLEAVLTTDCTSPNSVWRITSGFSSGFQVRNVESDLVLDIERSSTEPSTRAVLFDATGNANQRFFFGRFRGELTLFWMAPAHVQMQCLTATTFSEVQMWPCADEPVQGWRVFRADCPL